VASGSTSCASNELRDFENSRGWEKPIDYVYVSDLGFDYYPSALSVPADKLEEVAPCLELFVPLVQQATVDYAADPAPINELLAKYNEEGFGAAYWKTPIELNEAGFKVLVDDGLLANEGDSVAGFDLDRVQTTIDNVKDGFDDRSNPDVKPEDIATNEFIDLRSRFRERRRPERGSRGGCGHVAGRTC
jgi:hypothetical protein